MSILIVSLLVIFAYVSPLILYRIRTRKVNLKFKSLDGSIFSTELFLEKNDPLWKIIETQRQSIDDSE